MILFEKSRLFLGLAFPCTYSWNLFMVSAEPCATGRQLFRGSRSRRGEHGRRRHRRYAEPRQRRPNAERNAIVVKPTPGKSTAGEGGQLCIEMKIRLYKDGAMSKLLHQLANVSLREAVGSKGEGGGAGRERALR